MAAAIKHLNVSAVEEILYFTRPLQHILTCRLVLLEASELDLRDGVILQVVRSGDDLFPLRRVFVLLCGPQAGVTALDPAGLRPEHANSFIKDRDPVTRRRLVSQCVSKGAELAVIAYQYFSGTPSPTCEMRTRSKDSDSKGSRCSIFACTKLTRLRTCSGRDSFGSRTGAMSNPAKLSYQLPSVPAGSLIGQ